MNKMSKKLLTLLICLVFILLAIASNKDEVRPAVTVIPIGNITLITLN